MASFNPNKKDNSNAGFFNKILSDLSDYGVNYSDMIFRNSKARGKYELAPRVDGGSGNAADYYKAFSEQAIARFLEKKNISYFDHSYREKRTILQEYSKKTILRDYIRIITDEAIVYDKDKFFCSHVPLEGNFSDNIKEKFASNFKLLYSHFELNDSRKAKALFKKFIVEGFLAYEIIYDDRERNIIGLKELESWTLTPAIDPITFKQIQIQNADSLNDRRILLDTRIIYLSYSNFNDIDETSYIEPLIRPYNLYEILEQTLVMFRIAHATPFKKYLIPTDGLSVNQAHESISKLMAAFEDRVEFDSNSGKVLINGKSNIPYSKEVWIPTANGQTPTIEMVSYDGPNLLETDSIIFFKNLLKAASMIPLTRLDQNNPSGGNMFQDAAEVTREELMFARFIDSLRSAFSEIITKPLQIQCCLDFPELRLREDFKSLVSIEYFKDNVFERWKELNNLSKQVEIIGGMIDRIKITVDGVEEPYFHPEFLIKKYMSFTDIDLQENEKMKILKRAKPGSETGGGTEEAPPLL